MTSDFHPIRLPDRLTDGVVVLDPFRLDDAEAHWRGDDAEMRRRFDAVRPATLEETRGVMRRWIACRAAGGPQFPYAIRDAPGTLVGGCELRRPTPDRAHVSYWAYPEHRGHGYAARALALVSQAAGALAEIERFEAHIEADNLASRRVAEKNGFEPIGEVEDEVWSGGTVTRLVFSRAARMGPSA